MFKARYPVLMLATLFLVVGCSNQDHPLLPGDTGSDLVVLYRGEISQDPLEFEIAAKAEGDESASSALIVHGRNLSYDAAAGALAVDLSVSNESDGTLPLPAGITFLQFTGADVAVLDPDNDRDGSGALVRFPSAEKALGFRERILAPGEESRPRTLHLRVEDGATFGFVARIDMTGDPDDGFVRVGDYLEARGEYMENPDRLAALRYEVHACEGNGDGAVAEKDEDDGDDAFDCPQNFCYGRLNGPVTGLDKQEGWIEVMGTAVHWRDKGGDHRGYDWWTRVRLDAGMDDQGNVVACHFPKKPKRWDEVRGYVQEIYRNAAGRITGVMVLNTLVEFPSVGGIEIPPMGVLGGTVWDDRDGDGVKDADENGLEGVTVALSGDASATTVTALDGSYSFGSLAAGTYALESLGPDGYSPTTDTPLQVVLPADDATVTGADFGWMEDPVEPTGTISGAVWNDVDGDGVWDAGESGLAGVTVALSGGASATTATGPDGSYSFGALAAGDYAVESFGPGGMAPTTASPVQVALPTDDAAAAGVDFGWMQPASSGSGIIAGFVFDDANGNGVRDAGEAGIGGVTVQLGGSAFATTSTSSDGAFSFLMLGAGSYTVTSEGPVGWTYTTGALDVMLLTDFTFVTDADQGWMPATAP